MTTHDFEIYDPYPTTPVRENHINYENPTHSPPRLRRPPNIRMSLLEHKLIDTEALRIHRRGCEDPRISVGLY